MARRVPVVPPSISLGDVQNGRAVRGGTWANAGSLLNWLSGRGCTLIPGYCPGVDVAPGVTANFRWNVWPRATGLQRLWFVSGRPSSAGIATVTATAPTSGAFSSTGTFSFDPITSFTPFFNAITLVEDVSSPGTTEDEASLDLTVDSGFGEFFVSYVACFDVPRFLLASGEVSADVESLRPGSPIAVFASTGLSWPSSVTTDLARRNGVFQWSVPESDARSSTSTSFADVFLLPPSALARFLLASTSESTLKWRVYARATAANGEVRVTTSNSSNTDTITVTSGAGWAWWPLAGSNPIDVDAEDFSEPDGTRGGSVDNLDLEFRTVSGGGTIEVAAISIGEDVA